MQRMHMASIDLNLSVVLQALLEERSVSRAARRLNLSQSATSHALARLRELVGDQLFVRTSTGLVPTTRAEEMAPVLAQALAALEGALFSSPSFDPAVARRTFQIGTSDYAEHIIMPTLLTRLSAAAPNMDVWARPAPIEIREPLARGDLDLILAPHNAVEAEGLQSAPLWDDHFVCVMRRGHPLKRGKLTVERFASAKHAFIAPRGQPGGVVDTALKKLGLARRIAFTTPNFLVAPEVVAKTDLVITLASRIAKAFAKVLPLELVKPPLELEGFGIAMFWHERRDGDPAHRFLRDELARAASEL